MKAVYHKKISSHYTKRKFCSCVYILQICTIYTIISILVFIVYSGFSSATSVPIEFVFNRTQLPSTTVKQTIPDIFDLTPWRHILINRQGNQTLCTVPLEYQSIVNAYCHAHGRKDCLQIPCTMIYISKEFTENVQCLRGGKIAIGVKPDWICRKSPALELLSNPQRKPSIWAEAHTKLTSELYGQALAPYRDGGTSKWGLTLEGESIGYYPSVSEMKRVMLLFDITLGYDRRYFDLITDARLIRYFDQIVNRSNQRLTIEQVMKNKVKDRAPILWINNNCNTLSNRTEYVFELMRYIRVDALGKCGNSKWNESLLPLDPKIKDKEKMKISKEYLFTIAIENSLEYDYVTEKLWQPLVAGSIPLYLGAPNIDDWLPCSNYSCIINLRQFSSIRDLANFLNKLIENKEHYLQYHQWRNEVNVRSSFLKMFDYFEESRKYSIECLLCDMIYRNDDGTTRRKLLAANNPFNESFPSLI